MCMKLKSTDWPYEQDEVTFYKVFACNYLTNKYTYSPYYNYKWKVGENEVELAPPHGNYFYSGDRNFQILVFEGLHVFEELTNAEVVRQTLQCHRDCDCVVVKLIGKKEDFIAEGIWAESFDRMKCCVFTKLQVPEEEFDVLNQYV